MSRIVKRATGLFLLAFVGVCATSCVGKEDVQAIRKDLAQLQELQKKNAELLGRIDKNAANTPSPVLYVLSDVSRQGKNIAIVVSSVHITKGDRLFLGEDMWDVEYVKIYTKPVDSDGAAPKFVNGTVELLVTFGGKAKDKKDES